MSYLKPSVFKEFYSREPIEGFYGLDNEDSGFSKEERSETRRPAEYLVSQNTTLTRSQSEYVREKLDETAEVLDEDLDVVIPRRNLFSEESSSKVDEPIRIDEDYDAMLELLNMDSQMVGTEYASSTLQRARNSLE